MGSSMKLLMKKTRIIFSLSLTDTTASFISPNRRLLLHTHKSSKNYYDYLLPNPTSRRRTSFNNNLFKHTTTSIMTNNQSKVNDVNDSNILNHESEQSTEPVYKICPHCLGEGQIPSRKRRLSKKMKSQPKSVLDTTKTPTPVMFYDSCTYCSNTGIMDISTITITPSSSSSKQVVALPPRLPNDIHVAIIGGGIGGFALALACLHRGIPYTIYERDESFHERKQGYGLTMQQGGKALKSLGLNFNQVDSSSSTTTTLMNNNELNQLYNTIHSKRHIVHQPDGTVVGEWGMRVWGRNGKDKDSKRQNAHVPRQELRRMLYDRLVTDSKSPTDKNANVNIKWGHKLIRYELLNNDTSDISLTFETTKNCTNYESKTAQIVNERASVLVGCDGIRSIVRRQKIGDNVTPLRYLGCIVILGITSSPSSSTLTNDGEIVFQTADGTTRLYAMPFAKKGYETAGASNFISKGDDNDNNHHQTGYGNGETMWQLSFPMDESEAISLSMKGAASLKEEALNRCGKWHIPIPELLQSTPEELISGYPVYDREMLTANLLRVGTVENVHSPEHENDKESLAMDNSILGDTVTLLGDAAHPMSPFKGQGANQALLDAILLARVLYRAFLNRDDATNTSSHILKQQKYNSIQGYLSEYESLMLERTESKVKASAAAAEFLHTEVAIMEGNCTRGAAAREVKQPCVD